MFRSTLFKYSRLVSVITLTIILHGCATLDKEECQAADWRVIGYEDGTRGYSANRIGNHRKDCAKHGIAPDFDAYQTGRAEGLEVFCVPRNGYVQGLNGRRYANVCPSYLETDFLNAHAYGTDIYNLQKSRNGKQTAINNIQSDLENIAHEIEDKELLLVANNVTPQRRLELLRQIKTLIEEKTQLHNELHILEDEVPILDHKIADLKAASPYR